MRRTENGDGKSGERKKERKGLKVKTEERGEEMAGAWGREAEEV